MAGAFNGFEGELLSKFVFVVDEVVEDELVLVSADDDDDDDALFVGDPGPEILDALVAQQAPALLDRLRWQQHLNKHVVNKRRTIMSTTCSNGIGKSCLFHQV